MVGELVVRLSRRFMEGGEGSIGDGVMGLITLKTAFAPTHVTPTVRMFLIPIG